MLARVRSFTLLGIEAVPLTVECDIAQGLPGIHTVGLPDAAVRESSERVRAALRNTGFKIPPRRITISLAPADLPKGGAALDLPIALGILAAAGQVPATRLPALLIGGELGLDGSVRSVRGTLPAALLARRLGLDEVLLPEASRQEALAAGAALHAVVSLAEAVAVLRGERKPEREVPGRPDPSTRPDGHDLADVRGQRRARRALEVAAAGGHHLVLVGPPGCGKTMLARRLPGILPPLSLEESIEVTSVYSGAGLNHAGRLIQWRPFRAPHHTISGIGLVGGGRGPRPGEITLAHRGVLFLDELPEFGRGTLDVLRQPLESGEVVINRDHRSVRMPSRVALVGAMNPCPCGQRGRSERACGCTPAMVIHYRERVSGPLFDRFDIQVTVPPVDRAHLTGGPAGEASAVVAERVAAARERQAKRFEAGGAGTNGTMSASLLRRHADPGPEGRAILHRALQRLGLSARAHDGILRVARTIADLAGAASIRGEHVAEAVQYRAFDREGATTDQADRLPAPGADFHKENN